MFEEATPNKSKRCSAEIATTCLRAIASTGESERIYPKLQRPPNVKAEGISGTTHPQEWCVEELVSDVPECKFLLLICVEAGVCKRICRLVASEYGNEGHYIRYIRASPHSFVSAKFILLFLPYFGDQFATKIGDGGISGRRRLRRT